MKRNKLVLVAGLAISLFAVSGLNAVGYGSAGDMQPRPYIPGELIIKFEEGQLNVPSVDETPISQITINNQQLADALQSYGTKSVERLFKKFFGESDPHIITDSGREVPVKHLTQIYLLKMDGLADMEQVADELERLSAVIYAHPNYIGEFHTDPPDDPDFAYDPNNPTEPYQWGLQNDIYGWDIDALNAWNHTTGKEDVWIGILDSGLEPDHYDQFGDEFFGREVFEWSAYPNGIEDEDGHGTWVTGIAAANTNSGPGQGYVHGVAGVAGGWWYSGPLGPGLYIAKIGTTGAVLAYIIEALFEMASWQEIRTVTGSWGFTAGQVEDGALLEAIETCFECEKTLFFSSGNLGNAPYNYLYYPAAYAEYDICCAVGAMDTMGLRPDFSCYGDALSFVAPGTGIHSTWIAPDYYTFDIFTTEGVSGTSAASPCAAAVGALVWSRALEREWHIRGVDCKRILENSARHNDCIYGTAPDIETGYGCVNAWWALRHMEEPYELHHYDDTDHGKHWVQVGYNEYVTFTEPPNDYWPAGTYLCRRIRIQGSRSLPNCEEDLWFWPRPYTPEYGDIVGYSSDSLNNCRPWIHVDSLTTTVARMRTYSYVLLEDEESNHITHHQYAPGFYGHITFPSTLIAAPSSYLNSPLGIDENALQPEIAVVGSNLGSSITVRYQLPQSTEIRIAVYDVTGQRVTTLVSGEQSTGEQELRWDGTDDVGRKLGAGLYFIRIVTPDATKTAKVVLVN